MKLNVHILKNCCSLLLLVALGLSCKKESKTAVSETQSVTVAAPMVNGGMTAKLNSNSWTSIKNTATLALDTNHNQSAFLITGETATDMFEFGIHIDGASPNLAAGQHDIEGPKRDIVFGYRQKTSGGGSLVNTLCESGAINITSVDNVNKKFSGTFSFKLSKAAGDTTRITTGIFTNISYAVQ